MKLLTLKFFITLLVFFIPNALNSKELNDLKNLVIYDDQKEISEISFKNGEDKNVLLSEYENKLLILNFWATWCEPCKEEMPSLENLQNNTNFKNLKIEFTSNYVFQQNEYPDNNFEVFIATSQSFETVDISSPPDSYHLMNFNSSIDLKNKNSKRLSLSLKINNLLNKSYRNYLNRMRYYSHELGRNIIVGLNYNF